MDTKWKKSKLIKFLSVGLMLVMAFVFAFSTLQCVFTLSYATQGGFVQEIADLCENGKPSFFACPVFQNQVINDISKIENLFNDPEQYRKQLESVKESKVDEIVSAYASQKANIIKNELEYIAENYNRQEDYGESIYNENGYSEILDSQIPETSYENQKYIVDPYASKTVQMVQKILNYAEGTEFLKYASIVRYESFNEREFHYDTDIGYGFHCYNYTDTVDEIEAEARESLSNYIETEYQIYKSDLQVLKNEIKNLANLKYYVKKGNTVYTNMQSPEAELASIKSQQFYLVKENGEMLLNAGTYYHDNLWIYEVNDYRNMYQDFDAAAFYIGEEIVINGTDEIGELYNGYLSLTDNFNFTFFCAVASLIVLLFLCVIVFSCAGHKIGADGCTVAAIDKLPADIHLVLSGGAIFGILCLVVACLQDWRYPDAAVTAFFSVCFAVAFALLVEFAVSMARIKKAKGKIFANCLIVRFISFVFRSIARFIKWCIRGIRKTFFAYKMKHLKKKFILFAALWVLINAVMFVFIGIDMFGHDGIFGVISTLLLLVFDGATVFFVAKYMNTLDKIIVAATEHTSANLYGERLPQSLITLNESLKITKEEMDEAVKQAVKNERTKTELITNVSHDLKTPLTSIISYVDLLEKCDIKDEDALKYIDVLSDKSQNLKSLIENLIEASKASSGNIKINKVYLNLKELAAQATGEFLSDFEARDLELRFKEDCEDVRVFVDGPHTYRVLENLLSNAKKYSAKGTRVYASIRREGKFGVFELKNISKDPLNISPDELTERFVRGDASRGTEEGNGLGLSIAKQLCSLQGGELKLYIDGDLFKAAVYLPID